MKRLLTIVFPWLILFSQVTQAAAAPYFFASGDPNFIHEYLYHYSVYLYTGADTVTVAQTILNFDNEKVQYINFSTLGSRCTFWAPADPSLGYGNQTTPYLYNGTKLVISCGFTDGGYKSTGTSGDLIARIQATPVTGASGTTTLSFSDTLFRYIGTPITPGTNISLSLNVFISTAAANPTATPYPSPTKVNARTITADDLNIVEVGTNSSGSSQTVTSANSLNSSLLIPTLGISIDGSLDDSIPPPPFGFTPRPTDPAINTSSGDDSNSNSTSLGDVLSIQSLKEMLLPGTSSTDQRVVMVNILSTLAFLVILAILIWRLMVVSRMNRVKYRHLKEILGGELSALETKLTSEVSEEGKEELSKRIDEMRSELN
jgi:hypothetical protein